MLLTSEIDGTNGFVLWGETPGGRAGAAASLAPDVNGDGINDILIGADSAAAPGRVNAGKGYAVFGKPYDASTSFDLASVNGVNGFRITGLNTGDFFGQDVQGLGDINGDEFGDMIFGAVAADPNGNNSAGIGYVVYGQSGFSSDFNLLTITDGKGFRFNGDSASNQTGRRSSTAGDINDDGINDIIVSAPSADPSSGNNAGESYIIFGDDTGFPDDIFPFQLTGANGFTMPGLTGGDNLGLGVTGGGDLNNDGIDDFAMGAPFGDPPGTFGGGEIFVVFGTASPFSSTFDLALLNGVNGMRIDGIGGGQAGRALNFVGDVNADGIDDLLIADYRQQNDSGVGSGQCYIIFGSDDPLPAVLNLSSLNGSNGFRINGIDSTDEAGISVSSAGDMNGDGVGDIAIGAWFADDASFSNVGEVYVVFGSAEGFPPAINAADLDGTNGFTFRGTQDSQLVGEIVAGGVDVSGDGIDDLLITSPNADPNFRMNAGECYVIFGKRAPCLADVNGDGQATAADFTAWIVAFNANAPACDQNEDGDCTPADFTAWIANFNAGC